ncbi:MAG: Rieske 2Fe-2S domain-containing protein [Candidatus Dormibacteria bacterium]
MATGPAVAPTRRNFMLYGIASLMAAIPAAFLAPLLVYIFPTPAKKGSVKPLPITLEGGRTLTSINAQEAVRFQSAKDEAYLMKTGGGINGPGDLAYAGFVVNDGSHLTALATTCPHLGCSIEYRTQVPTTGKPGFQCPCHGSQFDIGGHVVHGPAQADMSVLDFDANAGTVVGEKIVE